MSQNTVIIRVYGAHDEKLGKNKQEHQIDVGDAAIKSMKERMAQEYADALSTFHRDGSAQESE